MRRHDLVGWVLATIVLVAWHGTIHSLPHVHDDSGGPRFATHCATGGAGADGAHLHRVCETLPHDLCFACLAGSTSGTRVVKVVSAVEQIPVGETEIVVHAACRGLARDHLAEPRAPPVTS